MILSDYLSAALLIAGAVFFLSGILGLMVVGLSVQAETWPVVGKLLLIWGLVLLALSKSGIISARQSRKFYSRSGRKGLSFALLVYILTDKEDC